MGVHQRKQIQTRYIIFAWWPEPVKITAIFTYPPAKNPNVMLVLNLNLDSFAESWLSLIPMKIKKFKDAQEMTFENALSEIQQGQKKSHWMWYIFPQMKGLSFSETSKFYAIEDLEEAAGFLKDPVLGKRLVQISQVLLDLKDLSASQIFGSPDDMKLKSSMTLFSAIDNTHPVFRQVLDKFFKGAMDEKTLRIIEK